MAKLKINKIKMFTWVFFTYYQQITESRLRVFDNRVLRRIFGPRRD
jgi:hypothetical protein